MSQPGWVFAEAPPIIVWQMLLNVLLNDWAMPFLRPSLPGVGRLLVNHYDPALRPSRGPNGEIQWSADRVARHGYMHLRIINPEGKKLTFGMAGECPPVIGFMVRTGAPVLTNSLSQTRAYMVGMFSNIKSYGGGQAGLPYVSQKGQGWQAAIQIYDGSRRVLHFSKTLSSEASAKAYADG